MKDCVCQLKALMLYMSASRHHWRLEHWADWTRSHFTILSEGQTKTKKHWKIKWECENVVSDDRDVIDQTTDFFSFPCWWKKKKDFSCFRNKKVIHNKATERESKGHGMQQINVPFTISYLGREWVALWALCKPKKTQWISWPLHLSRKQFVMKVVVVRILVT